MTKKADRPAGIRYELELPEMAYTLDDFKHDARRLLIEEVDDFSPEERQALLERMDVEDRLRGLDPTLVEEWLKRIKH